MIAVADAPDVHAGAQPDVLQRTQRFDLTGQLEVVWVILQLFLVSAAN